VICRGTHVNSKFPSVCVVGGSITPIPSNCGRARRGTRLDTECKLISGAKVPLRNHTLMPVERYDPLVSCADSQCIGLFRDVQ
jgi:hypothetical protein